MEPNIFKGVRPAVTLADIQAIEQKYGFVLPDSYKAHLLQFNGGWPTRRTFFQPASEQADSLVARKISDFYAVHHGDNTLEESIESLRSELHPDLVPFGSDTGGDQFVLSVGPEDYGSVYYISHEFYSPPEEKDEEGFNEDDEPIETESPPAPLDYGSGVHFLAPSFLAFLNGLVTVKPA